MRNYLLAKSTVLAAAMLLLLAAHEVHAQRVGFANRRSLNRVPAFSQRGVGLGARAVNLQETLEKGLKARRPNEFAFLKRVSVLVEQQRLPRALVQSTFDWARHKRPFPYPYFERALKLRAARLGLSVR